MSIDKTVKSDKVDLNTAIWFGIFKGSVPKIMIKSGNVEGIKYLLWMRSVLNEKGFPRFMFHVDLHHVLDNVLRRNALAVFNEYEPKYTETDYNLWLAEKRIERKKAEIAKEEEAQRKREELAKFQEQQRLKDIAAKRRRDEYLAKKSHEAELLKRLDQDRQETYATAWGEW